MRRHYLCAGQERVVVSGRDHGLGVTQGPELALEALRGDKTVQEIAAKHQLHPNQVSTWKRQAIDGMSDVFSGGKQSGPTEAEVKELHAKIGRPAVENDFLSEGLKR